MKGIKQRSQKAHSYSFVLELGKQIDPETGKPKRQQKRVTIEAGNKTEAGKIRTKMQLEIDTGVYVPPGKTTIKDYLESWLIDSCPIKLADNTIETYTFLVNQHIIPALGSILMSELKPQHLQRLYSEKLSTGRIDGKGGLSNRSVRYIHITLNKAFKSALKMGIIARNPCELVDVPKVQRHEYKVMNENDVIRFLDAAKKTEYFALFYCALFTGMRRSELLALRHQDVDLLLKQLYVNRALHHLNNGQTVYSSPKTDRSRRMIALSTSTCAVLLEYKANQDKKRAALGLDCFADSDLVFCHVENGQPYLPDSVTHAWMMLARRNGLTGLRLHDARHNMGDRMLKNGEHPKVVQERLGHATISTTLDIYSSVAPGMQAAAADKLDDIFLKHDDKTKRADSDNSIGKKD
jgi:integrase